MTTKRNWRIQAEHQRRRAALLALLESAELRPQDRLNAEAMLHNLDQNREAFKQGQAALREVDLLRQGNTVLTAEVAKLKDALAESEMAGNEAIDTLERERSERTQ